MFGAVMLTVFVVWVAAAVLAEWPPAVFVERGWDVDMEGLAVAMPFIVVFGGLAVAVIGAVAEVF